MKKNDKKMSLYLKLNLLCMTLGTICLLLFISYSYKIFFISGITFMIIQYFYLYKQYIMNKQRIKE